MLCLVVFVFVFVSIGLVFLVEVVFCMFVVFVKGEFVGGVYFYMMNLNCCVYIRLVDKYGD